MDEGIYLTYELDARPERPAVLACVLSPKSASSDRPGEQPLIDAVTGSHEVITVPYGTDASTLALAGIPSVVFGPGDIAKAHTCDEWVPLDEVEAASEILYRFACSG